MNSIGTKELKSVYNDAATALNSPASKILSFSINSYYGTISEKELVALSTEFKDNHVALNILRARVKSYVYNKELDFKTKQKFADILNMKVELGKKYDSKKIGN